MEKLQLVRVRGTRWSVAEVRPYEGCTLLTLSAAEASTFGKSCRVLTPFDDVEPIVRVDRARRMPLRRWRRACRALLASATPPGCLQSATTARIDLLPHQLEPALAVLRGLGARVLLADDVGLGKTIQAGLIVAELLARQCIDRVLVLTPAGVRGQWVSELNRFEIAALHADARTLRHLTATLPIGLNPWTTQPIAVVSIDYVKRAEVLPAVTACRWDLLVVDEAHGVANDSERRRAVESLAARASYVVLLSATPHSGDESAFANLCKIGAPPQNDSLLVFRRTRQQVRPHAIRRTRVLRVRPSRAERRMFAALERYQRAVRAEHGARALALSVLEKRAFSSSWSLTESIERRLAILGESENPNERQLLLPLLDDEGELSGDDAPPVWPADLALANANRERRLLADIAAAGREATRARESKVSALTRFLGRARQPALVFTEYRDTAAHVQQSLGRGLLLHGGLAQSERQRILHAFTSGAADLLIATDAAGQGLNLQHACRLVINLELPWNPMRLEQRIGRVDRIGQRRRVHAMHLVGQGTGEAQMLERLRLRVARARKAIGAPDPSDPQRVDQGDPQRIDQGDPQRVDQGDPQRVALHRGEDERRRELTQAAVHEAARLGICRSLTKTGDRGALRDLEAAPWWTARARRPARVHLAGRALFVYRVSAEDDLGLSGASQIITVAAAPTIVRPPAVPASALPVIDPWFRDAAAIERAFWDRRLERERTIVQLAAPDERVFQPALFDRRAARVRAVEEALRRDTEDSLRRRLVQAEQRAVVRTPVCQLLLVLLP